MIEYPSPQTLLSEAERIDQSTEGVSNASEYPGVARLACQTQVEALRHYADIIAQVGEVAPKRQGMTGEERRERRASILRLRAARLKVKASQHFRQSHDIGSRIPFGQPILVGHHSERAHRNAIERMHNNDRKAFQADSYAKSLESQANSVERHGAISATDADAIDQYTAKLATLTRERDHQKAVNAAWRKFEKKGDSSELNALGFPGEGIERLKATVAAAYSWEKQPFAKWSLTNLGARIRDIEKKLERLKVSKSAPVVERETENGIRVEDNPADNRLRLFFPGKPDEATRTTLKRGGFRWTPSLGCWQAFRNWNAQQTAKTITGAAI